MRDPTRENIKPNDRRAAIDVVTAAEQGRIECFMAEQVATEFSQHDQLIQQEAEGKLHKFRDQLSRVNNIVGIYGSISLLDTSHFDSHVIDARKIVGRWLTQLNTVSPSDRAIKKALARMNAGRAPARRGKESSKDCLVYETVIEKTSALRAIDQTTPIVFVSSNTKEYQTEGSVLNPEIAAEFGTLNLQYAPNMSAAKHFLGL